MDVISNNKYYTDIANAIRAKNETAETYKPSEMALAIVNIESGGIYCTLTITTTAGAMVEATFGNKTITAIADESGTAVLELPKEGLWTVTASFNGETVSKEIDTSLALETEILFSKPLAECTWEEISAVSKSGNAAKWWNIGDTKQITYNNKTHEVQIIGFDHDTVEDPASYGRTKAGITFQFKEMPTTRVYMNNADRADSSSWLNSTLRETMYAYRTLFEQSLQNVMVRITHDYDTSYRAGNVAQCSDLLFALSEAEYTGTQSKAANILGAQYEFYAAGNSKVKYTVGTTTADTYWTRSKSTKTSDDYFVYITSSGGVAESYSASTSGTPFAFCV